MADRMIPDSSTQSMSATKFKIFRSAESPSLEQTSVMTMAPMSSGVINGIQAMIEAGANDGQASSIVFCQAGFSLIRVWLKSGFPLPLHSHDVDCLYYVTAGSLRLGMETLAAGDGFFVGAGVPYSYTPGPDGVQILEFRSATAFDIQFKASNQGYWAKVCDKVAERREQWKNESHPGGSVAGTG